MAYDQKNSRVIIRVWTSEENTMFPGHNVGHVSIETAEQYMSFWPAGPANYTPEEIAKHRAAACVIAQDRERQAEAKRLGMSTKRSFTETLEYSKALVTIKHDELANYFKERPAHFMASYDDDCASEGYAEGVARLEPSLVVCLYSLDRFAIENEFHKVIASKNQHAWRLIGANLFFQNLEGLLHIQTTLGRQQVDSCVSFASRLLKYGGIDTLVGHAERSSFASRTSSYIEVDDILKILIPAKLAEVKKHPHTMAFPFPNETPLEDLKKSTASGCTIL